MAVSMKISVVTTFHKSGYDQYGKRMIQSFLENWPKEVELFVFAEDVEVTETAPNLTIFDLHNSCPDLVAFKNKWKDDPRANGDVSTDPIRSQRTDSGKGFKWDAVRFSNKVYAIFKCVSITDADVLFWMDADMVCHSPISVSEISSFCPENIDIGFLGREGKYTECGLYSLNLKSKSVKYFLTKFQEVYDNAEDGIFKMDEWHDSFVFDQVKKTMSIKEFNWSKGLIRGEGHPLINSQWGAYLDHLKGNRKIVGKSTQKDLKVTRSEDYWK